MTADRDRFIAALSANEDDTTTRLVYADWLDEQGEHEEADRQRRWPAAKQWIFELCEKYNPGPDADEYYRNAWISYKKLIQLGREASVLAGGYLCVNCDREEKMSQDLQMHGKEFWRNWSIVTGVPLDPSQMERFYFSCGC